MATAGVTVQGARELRGAMRKAGLDMGEMKAVHARVGLLVAQSTTPPRRSGRLAASIRSTGQAGAAVVRAGGAKVPYAGVIEYGWPSRNISAQPYLRTAAHRTEPRWAPMYLAEVQAILDRIGGV
jgi:phage gpG-like protein